ncbi:hypothetical protein Q4511_12090 [Paracoccus sp. 1_MG-2023]|uniref:hypothetical protein n=1 Tax=unclassified Paracoccus (in: a-proteobacteria) TaxID=2688777 RepID=UPI001C080701|nr:MULTISPECIES: hypothetical protein [unclassified Paracoccus (in: a-proteobacteria)]MBU2957464.1 hypothetical protein [Paracoccus sp. C2R09]MDO6669662.1 hypothetical protein [Paracoccus sp. 1_MG-2023]
MKYASALLLLLAACSEGGDFPRLLPTDQILADPALPAHAQPVAAAPEQVLTQADARAAALRARADALRGPVVEDEIKARAAN